MWAGVTWENRSHELTVFPHFWPEPLGLLLFTLFISNLFGFTWKTNKTVTTTTNFHQGHSITKNLYHERCLSNYAINCKANPWSIPHGLWAPRLELRSGFHAVNLEETYTSLDGSALKGLGKVGEQIDTPCSSQHHLFYTESAEQVPAESSGSGQDPEKRSCFWTEATESCPQGELSHTMWDGSSGVIRWELWREREREGKPVWLT